MNGPILKDWSVGWAPLAIRYKMPVVLSNICIRGVLYDNPKDKKGKIAVLDDITFLDVERGFFKTSKRGYLLGDPEEGFLKWLKESGIRLSEYNIDA